MTLSPLMTLTALMATCYVSIVLIKEFYFVSTKNCQLTAHTPAPYATLPTNKILIQVFTGLFRTTSDLMIKNSFF